jgi:hypothetical protein
MPEQDFPGDLVFAGEIHQTAERFPRVDWIEKNSLSGGEPSNRGKSFVIGYSVPRPTVVQIHSKIVRGKLSLMQEFGEFVSHPDHFLREVGFRVCGDSKNLGWFPMKTVGQTGLGASAGTAGYDPVKGPTLILNLLRGLIEGVRAKSGRATDGDSVDNLSFAFDFSGDALESFEENIPSVVGNVNGRSMKELPFVESRRSPSGFSVS